MIADEIRELRRTLWILTMINKALRQRLRLTSNARPWLGP